jgi:Nitrile hydratase, alpha chain
MSQPTSIQAQIIAKAMKDETFRQALLSNPKAVIERELGITIPAGVTIAVHQDTPTTLHFVLPMQEPGPAGEELSDAELEQAIGGVDTLHTCMGTHEI